MACPGKGSEQAGVTNQVTVPFGWERIVKDGLVSYISPSGVQLSSTDEVKAYLIADNTCKCGLECPVHIEKIFIFDGRVSSSSDPGGESSPASSSCKHAVRRNDGGEQRKPIHNQGLPIVSSNLRSSVLHPGGVLPVQMRPSLQRSDLLMQNSIEAQQHQIQLKIREASVRQAQVLSSDSRSAPTPAAQGGTSNPSGCYGHARQQLPAVSLPGTIADGSQDQVDLQKYSASFNLGTSMPTSTMLHHVLGQKQQQQPGSMHHHPGRLESNPPPNKRQRSKSLEEQQWYYSMMRNSAPLSPVGANIVPGVSTFYQPGLPLMNVYGQPSNLVSFQPSFPVAEYPMIFSRGGGNMSMMRHVTPVSLISQFSGAPLGIPCYGSTVPVVQGAGAVPFGMVPQPAHQRAFVRLPPVDPVSSTCNSPPNGLYSSSVPTSVVTSSPHIVLQAPKTVKDMLAENRSSQGRSDASGAESSQTRTSLGMEQEAVRNEVAETLCSLSSAGEVLFETNGSDIPSETKERSEQLVNNQRDCTTTADGRLDHEQKACGTTTHKGDVTITPGLSELEQASGVCGVHVKEVKHVRPVEEQTGVTSSQNSDSNSVFGAQSQLHVKGTVEQSTTVIDSQGLGLDQTSNQGFKTGGKEDGVKGDHKERGNVPSSCSPQALSTFLPTVSSYEKADSRDHRTSGETTKNHENDSLVQSDTALSNEEPVREDEQSSSVSSKMSHVEVDDDSVKETKIAAVETLLQLSSRETLYSFREGEANEQELTGASSIVSSVQSADVINDVINMHEPLKQLCNKTVWDNSCPSSAVGLLSDRNNSSLPSLRNESRDQMQLSDSVCESSASRCRDVTFVAKSGNENFELCVESETKHEDALVNSDLPNQRITTQNNSYSDTGLEERLVSHGLDESETKESQENIGDPCTDTREVRKNDGGVHLQENISTSEMDTEKGITLEAGCENVMCNDTNVCENNSSMVDAVKGRAQTLDESKQSLPGSYLTEVSDEDQIVNEREEISCPKDENIVEVGNKLNYLGVTVEKTDKVEVTDLKCDKVKGSKQCQDSNEMDIGQEVGRDETEASKSVILTHPVVTAKSDDKVESIILLQDDNNKMEIQEVVKDKAEASKSFKLTHREETTPTGEKNLLPQNRNVSNEMNPESSDKENVEDCDSSCVSRTMSPEPSEDTSQEDEKGCASKDEKLSSSDLTGDKISLSPNDSVLIDSTLININTEQEKHSLKEVESSNLLSSLDLAGSKSQTSIVNYTEDSVNSVNAAQVDPNMMAENGDVYLSGVPIGRGAEKDVLMNGSSLSCLNCSVKETTLSRSRFIKDQEQAFTNVGRITRRRRLDPVLAVETNGGSISSTEIPSRALRRHFETGDLVWGQLRGHTSWPGKLVSDGDVKGQTRKEHGKVWVMWFGDHSFAQVEPDKLKTLSEGLEAHHNARTRVSRYMNMARRVTTNLEAAIQEAMLELDKQSEQVKSTKRTISARTRQVKRQKNR